MKQTPKANTVSFFERAYLFLSKINPITIVISYALMTAMFGFFYWWLPGGSFYAPYTQFKPAAREDRSAFGAVIAEAVRRQVTAANGANEILGPNRRTISLRNISAKDARAVSEADIRLQLWLVTTLLPDTTSNEQPHTVLSLQRLNLILTFGQPQHMPNSLACDLPRRPCRTEPI